MSGHWSLRQNWLGCLPKCAACEPEELTLEVGHISPHIRVQGVNNHLPVGRASDLYSTVHKTWSWWCTLPGIVVTDVLGLWEEVESVALVELGLADHATLEESFPRAVEGAVEHSKENSSVLGEDLAGLVAERTKDLDVLQGLVCVWRDSCHGCCFCMYVRVFCSGDVVLEKAGLGGVSGLKFEREKERYGEC